MFERIIKSKTGLTLIIILFAGMPALCETLQLKQGPGGKTVLSEPADPYLLAVSAIKELINTGQCEQVVKEFDKLKKDFPKISGRDLDAFITAELLFCEGKLTKSGRAYEKFLSNHPQSPLKDVILDRQFAIATAFLGGQKKRVLKFFKMKGYAEGEKMMDNITSRAGNAPIARKAAVAVAKSLEERGKYNEAFYKWSEISSQWPKGQLGTDALLAKGRCKHAAYNGPRYDATSLDEAKSYYETFIKLYEQEAEEFKIDKRIEQIEEQLAYKQFKIGRYYQASDNKEAADIYYRIVINKWPNSIAAKLSKEALADKKADSEKEKSWKTGFMKRFEKLLL